MRRRRLLAGLGGLAGAGGIVGTGAFSSVSARRDVTVAVADDDAALLKLTPSGTANGVFAEQLDSGVLALDFDETDAGGTGLGTDSVYDFDDVFRVTNQGTQPVYVWGTFGGASGNFTPSGSGTDIWLYPNGNSGTKLRDDSDSVIRLDVGETVNIGVHVDTHDVTSDQELTMTIHADAERPSGAPGTTRPYPPINVSKAGEPTRYFHTIPTAAEYASGGEDVVIGIEEGTYPRKEPAFRVTDPSNSRNWVEYVLSPDSKVEFTSQTGSSVAIQWDSYGVVPSTDWIATIDDGGESATIALADLFDPSAATANSITYTTNSKTIELTGESDGERDAIEFTRSGTDETLAIEPSSSGDSVAGITLTSSDATVTLTAANQVEDALSRLGLGPKTVSVTVPDTLEVRGVGGLPSISHQVKVVAESSEERIEFCDLTFGETPSSAHSSIEIEANGSGTVTDLRMIRIELERVQDVTDGVLVTDTIRGLQIESCTFEGRQGGFVVQGGFGGDSTTSELEIRNSVVRDNQNGMVFQDVQEGYIWNTDFVDNEYDGLRMDDPDAVGMEGLTVDGNETGIDFDGDIASVDDKTPLADQIESNVSDDTKGKTGIVDSTFTDNGIAIEGDLFAGDMPAENCEFESNGSNSDIKHI